MIIIKITLGVVAFYCFAMWLLFACLAWKARATIADDVRQEIAQFTFRVGLCGILAIGFLGLILQGG